MTVRSLSLGCEVSTVSRMTPLLVALWLAAAPEEPTAPEANAQPEAAAPAQVPTAAAPTAEAPVPVKPLRFVVSLGFQHWYGATFGAPIGITTPGLTLGLVLVRFLELQLQYSLAVVPQAMPDGSLSRVGFFTLGAVLRKEVGFDGQRLVLGCGPQGGIVHTSKGVRAAMGAVMVARYLVNTRESFALGPFVDLRAMLYQLPESNLPIYRIEGGQLLAGHSDAQVQVGVAAAF